MSSKKVAVKGMPAAKMAAGKGFSGPSKGEKAAAKSALRKAPPAGARRGKR